LFLLPLLFILEDSFVTSEVGFFDSFVFFCESGLLLASSLDREGDFVRFVCSALKDLSSSSSSLNCEDCKRKGLCGLERDEDAVDSDFEDTENLDPVVCEAVIDEVATL
jgi:hypothetical protein